MHSLIKNITNWVLGPIWQAILLASIFYTIPLFDFAAILVQVFVTMRQGINKGLIVTLVSIVIGSCACYILASMFVVTESYMFWDSLIWAMILSVLLCGFASILRKTVSLSFTTQFMTIVFMLFFAIKYYFDINLLPAVLKDIITKLVIDTQTTGASANSVINSNNVGQINIFLVHLFEVTSLYSLQIMLLMLARMWQSYIFMPKEFIKEFIKLRSSKFISMLFVCLWLLEILNFGNLFLIGGMLFTIVLWFFLCGIAFTHWVINTYNYGWTAVGVFYILLFIPVLSSILLFALIIIGILDGFIDQRSLVLKFKKR